MYFNNILYFKIKIKIAYTQKLCKYIIFFMYYIIYIYIYIKFYVIWSLWLADASAGFIRSYWLKFGGTVFTGHYWQFGWRNSPLKASSREALALRNFRYPPTQSLVDWWVNPAAVQQTRGTTDDICRLHPIGTISMLGRSDILVQSFK